MLTKDDLFTSVSPSAIEAKQDSTPGPEKRKYAALTKPKRMVTQAERYQVGKTLEGNLTPKDANGLVSYLNGMTDAKIAKLVGPNTSIDTVRHMRQEVFGILRKVTRGQDTGKDDMLARIVKLEELFNKLAEEIGSASRV